MNKSTAAQLTLLNGPVAKERDVIVLQELAIDHCTGLTKANSHWRAVYLTHKFTLDTNPRAITLVNTKISTNNWEQIPFPSRDVVIVQFRSAQGARTLINIYNDGTHNRTLEEMGRFLALNAAKVRPSQNDHMFWLGDFNRHHPMWDEERNSHLFTTVALDSVQKLLDLLVDFGMVQALPKDIPTLQSSSTGNWTRPNSDFCTDHSEEILILCTTDPGQRGLKTDHVLVLTELDLAIPLAPDTTTCNYRAVDWEEFNEYLNEALACLPPPAPIIMEEDFQRTAKNIDLALHDAVEKHVLKSRPCPHTWHWWTKELTDLKKHANQLSHLSHKFRALPDHTCHRASKDARNKLANEVFKAKKEHWCKWLEEATGDDIWMAHCYIKTSPGNGSRTCIPTLKGKNHDREDITAMTNKEKGDLLAQTLFPPPPDSSSIPADFTYPDPVDKWAPITWEHLNRAIQNLQGPRTRQNH